MLLSLKSQFSRAFETTEEPVGGLNSWDLEEVHETASLSSLVILRVSIPLDPEVLIRSLKYILTSTSAIEKLAHTLVSTDMIKTTSKGRCVQAQLLGSFLHFSQPNSSALPLMSLCQPSVELTQNS